MPWKHFILNSGPSSKVKKWTHWPERGIVFGAKGHVENMKAIRTMTELACPAFAKHLPERIVIYVNWIFQMMKTLYGLSSFENMEIFKYHNSLKWSTYGVTLKHDAIIQCISKIWRICPQTRRSWYAMRTKHFPTPSYFWTRNRKRMERAWSFIYSPCWQSTMWQNGKAGFAQLIRIMMIPRPSYIYYNTL